MQELNNEEIWKAAEIACNTACRSIPNVFAKMLKKAMWSALSEEGKWAWYHAVNAAAPHLQYAKEPAAMDAELGHYMNCPGLIDCGDCDCGLIYRKQIQALQSKHNAELIRQREVLTAKLTLQERLKNAFNNAIAGEPNTWILTESAFNNVLALRALPFMPKPSLRDRVVLLLAGDSTKYKTFGDKADAILALVAEAEK